MRKFILTLIKIFLKVLYKIDINGLGNIPKEGKCILASNHIHYFDVAVLQTQIDRNISFIAKKELYKIPVIGYVTKLFDSIPLDRNKRDLNAVKSSIKFLEQGKLLGIFPEGTRISNVKKGKKQYRVKNGAVKLAYENDVLIVPVGIKASYRIFSKIIVNIGIPYKVDINDSIKKYKAYNEASEKLIKKIYNLAGVKNEYLDS